MVLSGGEMRKLEYHSGGDFEPEIQEPYFAIQCDCFHCGNKTSIAIDKDRDYDRTEAEYWEERYKDLMGTLNTKIAMLTKKHGFDPIYQEWIEELARIRDELANRLE